MKRKDFFHRAAHWTSQTVGNSYAFVFAVLIVLVWAISGPYFDFSDTWQLVINTGTTILTFLMVFLIQNTQNRDAKAIHLKLDELLRGTQGTRNSFVDIEDLSDSELSELESEFQKIRQKYVIKIEERKKK
jgi:low affinity Fe/Cu permease